MNKHRSAMPSLSTRLSRGGPVALLLVLGVLVAGAPAAAQSPAIAPASGTDSTLVLTLDDALRVGLERSYGLRGARLNIQTADAQIREAWGQLYPQLSVSGNYTRNLQTANPFAGSDVTGLFAGGNATEWIAFNEQARIEGTGDPISFEEFQRRRRQGQREAGITPGGGGGNPFGVDNQFSSGLSLRQTLFSQSAFAAVRGARQLRNVNQLALDRERQALVDSVRSAFYGALLAQEQARVARQSVERTKETLADTRRRVEEGTAPKYQRLSADVELSNLRTRRVQAENRARLARERLKLTLALPMDRPIALEGSLTVEDPDPLLDLTVERATQLAFDNRPDLERARQNVELREVEENTVRAQYLPTVSAVANFDYTGRVPDDRSQTLTNPTDPFDFSVRERGFFHSDFWNPSLNVGLQLSWTIFDGFQRESQIQQQEVAVQRAELQREQQQSAIQLQIEQSLRSLRAAYQRLQAQRQNVETAELNYEYTRRRVENGVSSQLELREASSQLDESRLNRLQATYDYLRARSALERATGVPLSEDSAFQRVAGSATP